MFIQYVIQMAVLLATYNYVLTSSSRWDASFAQFAHLRKVDKMHPYLKRYKRGSGWTGKLGR